MGGQDFVEKVKAKLGLRARGRRISQGQKDSRFARHSKLSIVVLVHSQAGVLARTCRGAGFRRFCIAARTPTPKMGAKSRQQINYSGHLQRPPHHFYR